MRVAFDIDDTIADLHEIWLGRLNKEHNAKWTSDDLTQWHFWNDLGLTEKDIYKHLVPDLYEEVKPLSEALNVVNSVRTQGHEIAYISSCPNVEHWKAKFDWLVRFSFLSPVSSTDRAYPVGPWASIKSKRDVGTINQIDVLVDDSIANCEDWAGVAFLLTRPHNRSHLCKCKRLKKLSDLLLELKYMPATFTKKFSAGQFVPEEGKPFIALQSAPLMANEAGWVDEGMTNKLGGLLGTDSMKLSNPKDIIGSDKLPLHLWPETATLYGCLGMLEGALKYGRNNFRAVGVRSTIYIDAARRHLNAWAAGEELASDSGLPHLGHALACLAILVEAIAQGNLVDDRDYKGEAYLKLVDKLTPEVKRLKDKYADRSPKHYLKDTV